MFLQIVDCPACGQCEEREHTSTWSVEGANGKAMAMGRPYVSSRVKEVFMVNY